MDQTATYATGPAWDQIVGPDFDRGLMLLDNSSLPFPTDGSPIHLTRI